MKLSKQQRINRQKLESLNHPGILMMLVDFIMEDDQQNFDGEMTKKGAAQTVSKIAAELKVRYMNDITQVESVKQLDIETAIENENKTKK